MIDLSALVLNTAQDVSQVYKTAMESEREAEIDRRLIEIDDEDGD